LLPSDEPGQPDKIKDTANAKAETEEARIIGRQRSSWATFQQQTQRPASSSEAGRRFNGC
jgi:hypothetical protein